jgi:hypothetical protein
LSIFSVHHVFLSLQNKTSLSNATSFACYVRAEGALKAQLTMADTSSISSNKQDDAQNTNNNNGNGNDSDDDDDDDVEYLNMPLEGNNFNSNNGNGLDADEDDFATPTVCVYGSSGMSGPHELGAVSGGQPGAPLDMNVSVPIYIERFLTFQKLQTSSLPGCVPRPDMVSFNIK